MLGIKTNNSFKTNISYPEVNYLHRTVTSNSKRERP